MNDKYKNYAVLFKALSDENRLLIIDYLRQGECCACKILEQLHITQPTLSHHMKILCDANMVTVRKEGKWMHYTLNQNKFKELNDLCSTFTQSEAE